MIADDRLSKMKDRSQHPVVVVLRWVAVLPASILAAWLGWIAINLLGRFSLTMTHVDTESFLAQLYFSTTGHFVMGAAFVFAGGKVAPSAKVVVAYILGGLAILVSGFLLFPAIIAGDGWAIWGGFSSRSEPELWSTAFTRAKRVSSKFVRY